MKKRIQYLVFIILITGVIFVIDDVWFDNAEKGALAPDFETTLIDGSSFKLSDLRGKYVLLDFWGSWCPPCRKENPKLAELHQKYSDELTIVTVALEKDTLSWKKAAQKDGFVWKNQIVDRNRFVRLSSIARKYDVTEIPVKFLISPDGKLIGKCTFAEVHNLFSLNK